ncbi:hypothetical protein HK102_000565 [Quaeritorhiza haematococci]|nr:hypothetical protein HK102_000565 [Quaeritorhiza haematococci]
MNSKKNGFILPPPGGSRGFYRKRVLCSAYGNRRLPFILLVACLFTLAYLRGWGPFGGRGQSATLQQQAESNSPIVSNPQQIRNADPSRPPPSPGQQQPPPRASPALEGPVRAPARPPFAVAPVVEERFQDFPGVSAEAAASMDIDQVQVQLADFLYGTYSSALLDWNDEKQRKHDKKLAAKGRLSIKQALERTVQFSEQSLNLPINETDFLQVGRFTRTYLHLFTIYHDRPDLHSTLQTLPAFQSLPELIKKWERKIYPWAFMKHNSIKDMRDSYKGRGIVMTSGRWHFPLAIHAIICLRRAIGTKLPIEVFYAGEGDTEPYMVHAFEQVEGVKVIDVTKYFDKEQTEMSGWAIKTFSLLASSFEEIVFLDADVFFLQDPERLFDFERYKKTGTVFFHDRSIVVGKSGCHDYIKGFVKDPSPVGEKTQFWRERSIHEMESGVLVFNKTKTLHGLLAVAKMNSKDAKEAMYKMVHGDKETFWVSFELIHLPYDFAPNYGGTVGYKQESDGAICGGLYHVDENERPLWWNGGIQVNKYFHIDRYLTFNWVATDRTGENPQWQWETENSPFCLTPTNKKEEIKALTASEAYLAAKFVELAKEIKKLGDQKKWDEAALYVGA